MANEQQKKPRKNTSLSDWLTWTHPHLLFKNPRERSLLDRTVLGMLIRIAFLVCAAGFHLVQSTPVTRHLTPLVAVFVLPLLLWNVLDLLVACVATPLLWAGERVMNAVLDVFKPNCGNDGPDGKPSGSDPGNGPSGSHGPVFAPQASVFSQPIVEESNASSAQASERTARPA